jgi:putative methanogenesis marker protein 8
MKEFSDEHIIEAIGRCRVVVRNGKVVEVSDPIIADCPLAKRFAYPVPEITKDAVKANIEARIKSFGMCTPNREVLDTRTFVGFGASELLSFGIHAGFLDAAVIACDGAGTVIATTPALVQGVGGRMSGLVKTSPYPQVIDQIEKNGGFVLDHKSARMDQAAGMVLAYEKGLKKIAVTVATPNVAEAIRRIHPGAFIVAVHVSGLNNDEAERLVRASDLVTSCASKTIREAVASKALVQAGISIPVFAMTVRAKELIIEKIRQGDEPVLIKPTRLPVAGDKEPRPLI